MVFSGEPVRLYALFKAARNVAVQIPARMPVRVRLLSSRGSTPVGLGSVEGEGVDVLMLFGSNEVRSVEWDMVCEGEKRQVSDSDSDPGGVAVEAVARSASSPTSL